MVSNSQNFNYTFPSNGTYLVCLTASGNNGEIKCSKKVCKKVTVEKCETAPCEMKTDFKYIPTRNPCVFSFADISSIPLGVTVTNWEWTVNGVVVSNSQNFIYTFPSNGVYTVCLVTYGNNGITKCSDKVCKRVTLRECFRPSEKKIHENEVLQVWPNPSNGTYNLNMDHENFNIDNVKVYDILGNEISIKIGVRNGHPFLNLDTNKSGMYMLILNKGDRVVNIQLIKN